MHNHPNAVSELQPLHAVVETSGAYVVPPAPEDTSKHSTNTCLVLPQNTLECYSVTCTAAAAAAAGVADAEDPVSGFQKYCGKPLQVLRNEAMECSGLREGVYWNTLLASDSKTHAADIECITKMCLL
uniref:Uncharacterized protein n=1 Tax=Lygus hesperus TaxID=30085 RepID=A0A146M6L8_LYGHE